MADWKEYKIGDIVEMQKGFAFKSSDYTNHGVKIVKVSNLNQKRFDDDCCVFILPSLANNYSRYSLKEDDIIISTVGSWPTNPESVVGKVCRIPKRINGSLLNQNAVRLRTKDGFDQKFLYYLLTNSCFSSYIANTAQGSANQASITLDDIRSFSFMSPDRKGQEDISTLLNTLDDKIECNRRINENLEQQAQALFKSWFVDFEPFKDQPFVESELGMIPQGWKVGKLEDLCNVFTGKKDVNQSLLKGKYPFFSCSPTYSYSNEYVYDGGAVIIAGNGSYTGRTSFYMGKYDLYQRTYSCVLKDETRKELIAFIYFMMKQFFEPSKMGGTRGSSIPYIVMKDITLQSFVYDESVMSKFSSIGYIILLKILTNSNESRRLAELRDALLPKLMSGEINVNDVTF